MGLGVTAKLALCAFLATACVDGGDTGDAATQGTLGGPCFANNTCNTGLDCVLVNGKGVCEAGDASVQDASGDTTTSDATGDATGDAPNDTTASDAPVDAGCDSGLTSGAACYGNCSGELCCPINGQCFTSGCGVNCNGMCWSCAKGSDCPGNYCCAMNTTVQPTCPLTTDIAPASNVYCSSVPCAGGVFLCLNNADCPTTAPTCTPAKANGLSANTIGICQ